MFKPRGFLSKDGSMVNHRSWLKILLNPILRVFSWQIGTLVDSPRNPKEWRYVFERCEWRPNIFKNYYYSLFTCNDYDCITKIKGGVSYLKWEKPNEVVENLKREVAELTKINNRTAKMADKLEKKMTSNSLKAGYRKARK